MSMQAAQIEKWYFRRAGEANRFFAVKKTDVSLPSGTLTVLTGKSGSGKTTLLHILAGLLRPDAGTVLLGTTDLYALSETELARVRNEHIALIPQGQSAISSLSVLENVLLPVRMYDRSSPQQEAEELLARFGIRELADASPGELSGGELRRMAIARALLSHPDVILADEPTGDLDEENTHIVMEALKTAATDGAAVLVATHETEAVRYADVHWTMTGGEIRNAKTEG